MAALMAPIPGNKNAQHDHFLNHPSAPNIENPTDGEKEQLDGYWQGVFKHLDLLKIIQLDEPGYMPPFTLITI